MRARQQVRRGDRRGRCRGTVPLSTVNPGVGPVPIATVWICAQHRFAHRGEVAVEPLAEAPVGHVAAREAPMSRPPAPRPPRAETAPAEPPFLDPAIWSRLNRHWRAAPAKPVTLTRSYSPPFRERCAAEPPRTSPSIRRRRSSSAGSRTPARSGTTPQNSPRTTASDPRSRASPSPTPSRTPGRTPAPVRRREHQTPPRQPSAATEKLVAHRGSKALS